MGTSYQHRHRGAWNEIAGGKACAELPQDDPNRQVVMTASFLQASLFTSVLASGLAAPTLAEVTDAVIEPFFRPAASPLFTA